MSGLKTIIPFLNEPFANQTFNEHIQEFINVAKEGPEKVEELLNGLFVTKNFFVFFHSFEGGPLG
ncbi:hypothetical protein QF028_004950 [Neobacillus sp. B4I6]|uniref:hypothetical protein n=1 Tax=Neobacillus sp. B4I6 TaxID=3373925 RepID=UPI003D19DF70